MPSASRTMLALSATGSLVSDAAGTPSDLCDAAARCMPELAVGTVAAITEVVCGTRAAQLRMQMSPRTSRPAKMKWAPFWRSQPWIRTNTQCRRRQIGTTRQASRKQPPALGVGGMPSASRTMLALSATGSLVSDAAGTHSGMCGAVARCMPAPAVGTVAATMVVCGTRAAQLRIQTSPRTSRPEKMRSAPSWRSPPRIRTQTQCRQKKIGKKSLASRRLPPVLEVGGMPSASRTVLALSALDIPESGAAGTRLDMCGAGALRMPAPAVGTAAAMEEVGPFAAEPSPHQDANPLPAKANWDNETALRPAALNSWGRSFCEAHQVGAFCNGYTRVRCCRSNFGYVKCGTTAHASTCGWRGGGSYGGVVSGGAAWTIHPGWRPSSFCRAHHVGFFCYSHHKVNCCNDHGHFVECTTTSQARLTC